MGVDLYLVESQFGLFSLVLRGLPFDDLTIKFRKHAHRETECRDDDVEKPNGPLMKDHQTCAGCCVEFLRSIRPGPYPGHDLQGNLEAVTGNKPCCDEGDGDNGNGGSDLPTVAQQPRNGIVTVREIDDVKPSHEQHDERRVARGPTVYRQQPDHEGQQYEAKGQVDHKRQTFVRAHAVQRFIRLQR